MSDENVSGRPAYASGHALRDLDPDFVTPPKGYQTCNVYRAGVQTSHLVRWVNGGTPGRTVLCGLTRFNSAPGARDADLPGWSMGGGVYGPNVRQEPCSACWEAAR